MMWEITRHADLAAPQRAVWEFITDPANFSAYVDGYADGKVTTPHPTGMCARYVWHARLWVFAFRSEEEIVGWLDCNRVDYRGTLAGVAFMSSMSVAPVESGTRLTVTITFRSPWWLGGAAGGRLLLEPLVDLSVRRSLDKLTVHFGDLSMR